MKFIFIYNIDYFFCNARMSILLSRISKGILLLICITPRSMTRNRMRITSALSYLLGVLIGTPTLEPFSSSLLSEVKSRNATLGHGHGDDRAYPDRVVIKVKDDPKKSLQARFSPIFVTQIQMSKLHTGICDIFDSKTQHTNFLQPL